MKRRRWPWHPWPEAGESLSSWLTRMAAGYGLSLDDLLAYDLEAGGLTAAQLDLHPSPEFLARVSERSGVPEPTLRTLTLASWVPWLFDRLEPASGDFGHYVAYHVLLPAGARRLRDPKAWRPWLSPDRESRERACRVCLAEASFPWRRLEWRLLLLQSCPLHGGWLEPAQVWPSRKVAWERTEARTDPVPPEVRILDQRNGRALTEGAVDLPRRRLHAGVWFRLFRSVLDELSTPVSRLRHQRGPILGLWEGLALPPRGGVGAWKPFESYGDAEQETLLRAAARALALIEAGEMEAPGEAADLFRCEPIGEDWPGRVVAAVRAKESPRELWANAMEAAEAVVEEARTHPETARMLRAVLLHGRTDPAVLAEVDSLLARHGIPLYESGMASVLQLL